MSALLNHIRVLDFSRVLAGPYCSMLMGDLGAEVIKIERPGSGDDTRQWGPPFLGDQSAYFLCCNRNKRSVTLNLKSQPGRDLAIRLAEKCDVVLENFLPGTMDQLGLGYQTLSQRNPKLVYCSITGFGQSGPYRDLPGYDIIIQGLSGLMSITGSPDGPPMKVGVAISDITAGLFASNAILAALVARERTGRGEQIDIALLDSTIAWLANVGSNYLATGVIPARPGNTHANIVPYQLFDTADRPIIVAVGNDAQYQRFCAAIDRPDLSRDERFLTNPSRVQHRHELIPQIAATLRSRGADAWLRRLADAEVPVGPVNCLDRVFQDPQVLDRNMLVELPHSTAGQVKMAGTPFKLGSGRGPAWLPPPLLGEHSKQVLAELLEIDDAEFSRYVALKAV